MKHFISAATRIKYKTDGVSVWWFSFRKQDWLFDEDTTPEILENMLKTGNAYMV